MNQITETSTTNVTDPTSRPAQEDFILLDASGSMQGRRQDSTQAIDNFVAQLRSDSINTTVTVAAFSGSPGSFNWRVVRKATPDSWSDMQYDVEMDLGSGMTPLYDGINMMGQDLRSRMPLKCSAIIITDGDENASQTTVEQAKAILDWMRAMGWQITFLGCDFENSRQAKLLGANDSNAIGVQAKRLTDATSVLAEKRARYGLYGTDMDLTKDDKAELGGLLPDHTSSK